MLLCPTPSCLSCLLPGPSSTDETALVAMDFFLLLPPELLLLILSCLTLEEVFMCLQVCRQWRERVSSFDSSWRRKCLQYGLPDYYIQEEEEGEKRERLVRLAYKQRKGISRSRGSVVLHKVPRWGKEEEDVHSFGCYGAGSGVVLRMLCREVIFKTNQSFSILKSDGGEKNFMFRGIGIHIFDQSQGCFKPVTIVTPSIKVCEPRIIFSRASVDQSWVMIVLFDDHFVEGFSLHKVFLSSSSSSSSSSPSNPSVKLQSN